MDPYTTLGVTRNATPDEIKSAYRKLASKHHPDRGGDTKTFQSIQQAYDILSDPTKRAHFDNPMPQHPGMNFGMHDFFQDIVGQFTRQSQQRIYTTTVFLTLEQIAKNKKETIQLNTGQGVGYIEIDIPPDVDDGKQYRFNRIMSDGLLHITFRIYKHSKFEKHGLDLISTSDVNILKLITGTKILVDDIFGNTLELTVTPMTKPGTKLRIPNKGLPGNGRPGDQYVLINGVLPDTISDTLIEAIKQETK